MNSISIYVTKMEEKEEICCYDDYSMILFPIIKAVNSNATIVHITDLIGMNDNKDWVIAQINKIIDIYGDDKDTVIITSSEINALEFENESISENPDLFVEKVESALLRDADIIKSVGFKHIDNPALQIQNCIPFIYPSELGMNILESIDNINIALVEEEEKDEI